MKDTSVRVTVIASLFMTVNRYRSQNVRLGFFNMRRTHNARTFFTRAHHLRRLPLTKSYSAHREGWSRSVLFEQHRSLTFSGTLLSTTLKIPTILNSFQAGHKQNPLINTALIIDVLKSTIGDYVPFANIILC